MSWGVKETVDHLQQLLTPGLIGNYQTIEVTEILGFQPGGQPTNVLSLLVAEPGSLDEATSSKPLFLNKKPLVLPSTDWKFGVSRSRIAPARLIEALQHLAETGEWKIGSHPLQVAKLTPVAPQFVPSDEFQPHPWNGVLKNNFFNGSHVLELFDRSKETLRFLFDRPELLKALAEVIRPCVPMGIDGLSDRLGNILIQFPVTAMVTKFGAPENGKLPLEHIWHPSHSGRPLRISWEIYEDATVEDYSSAPTSPDVAALVPIHSKRMGARYVAWDDDNKIVVGASAETAYFGGSVTVTSHGLAESVEREFYRLDASGRSQERVSILLQPKPVPQTTQKVHPNVREPWRSRRLFRESLHSLQSRKEFIQYRGAAAGEKNSALEDVHWLINRHGKGGVWIWDPYLDAKDVLNTLFFCQWPEAELRALSAGSMHRDVTSRNAPATNPPSISRRCLAMFMRLVGSRSTAKPAVPPVSWRERQEGLLEQTKGNCKGLNLEFRVRSGSAGWPFHDRFLIFPGAEGGAIAWSLGTSINSLGQQHHILQKVSDGELIREAFLELWEALDAPSHLVWKTA
ncbi:VPA1262 family N-terminal domain-containing protein [Cupriavidus taiwanensis]|uniref:VPA1262 family N-terminal domain-containing protein n=1 Tax=Cupriavidus taiwanensis TaxID=164546 RepID=UPI000E10D8C8|nr:VPA1262 family N-terminal domain-containing protein [Cupriavidus taiwanensis]SPA56692.1 conserved protein of unknown function [Cupriavidus taiwanensis]